MAFGRLTMHLLLPKPFVKLYKSILPKRAKIVILLVINYKLIMKETELKFDYPELVSDLTRSIIILKKAKQYCDQADLKSLFEDCYLKFSKFLDDLKVYTDINCPEPFKYVSEPTLVAHDILNLIESCIIQQQLLISSYQQVISDLKKNHQLRLILEAQAKTVLASLRALDAKLVLY